MIPPPRVRRQVWLHTGGNENVLFLTFIYYVLIDIAFVQDTSCCTLALGTCKHAPSFDRVGSSRLAGGMRVQSKSF
jgi:hypothetical protein